MDDFMKKKIEEFKKRNSFVEKKKEVKPKDINPVLKLFNIHKRSLPPGIDTITVYNVTKKEGEWWLESILKAKCYQDESDDSKTLIYYDLIPVDAKPYERSIYHNSEQIMLNELPDFKTPKRIN